MKYRVLLSCLVALLSSSVASTLLYRLAEPLRLVDRPNDRKKHAGNISRLSPAANQHKHDHCGNAHNSVATLFASFDATA